MHSQQAKTSDNKNGYSPAASSDLRLGLQYKLDIGSVNDPLEAEADVMADRVMRMPDTPLVQQRGLSSIQRSCTDGNCETCAGGRKTLWFTVFFRTRATRSAMRALRERINEAKRILNNCCITVLFSFDWSLLRGGTTFNWGNDPSGADYSDEAENLGEGTTFSRARGIPIVVADTVSNTGGGVTVTPLTDPNYTGRPYIAISITHGRIRAIAHEGGHVGGILTHTAISNVMDNGIGGTAVSDEYCNAMRTIAT